MAQTGRKLIARGWPWPEVARLFQITARTLRRWCRDPSAVRLRGRPVERAPRITRNEVIHFLDEHGPHVGVPTLRECFPTMSRAELTDLLRRYRRVWRIRHRVPLRVLHWLVPGRVWSIDFTGPLKCLLGGDRYVLAVRDLASGYQLLWHAVPAATAKVACAALAELFAHHGAPVVLKSDNGSAFTSDVVRELLAEYAVVSLYSPPYWPRYNGAIEAGIGSLKDRTACWSARSGHAGVWTWDDLAGARAEANELARPWSECGASPSEAWSGREPIREAERAAFVAAVRASRETSVRELETCAGNGEGVISEASVARRATELALLQCGYLQYRRRSIPPPITRKKVT